MEYFVLLIIIVILIFLSEYFYWEKGSLFFILIIVGLVFSVWNHEFNLTPAEKLARDWKEAEEIAPVTTKVPMIDGCTLYYHFGNGRLQSYTTKYVKCENATVTTEKKYSCGTPKAPRTCTEEIVTKSN